MKPLNAILGFLLVSLLLAGNALGAGESGPARTANPGFTGMFELYQNNRVLGTGNFVTADFLLTSYNLLLENVVGEAEEQELFPRLQSVARVLQKQIFAVPGNQPGRNRALRFISVLRGLLGASEAPPAEVADQVQNELKLIAGHAGVVTSPITGTKEDYTQFVPRGRYTRTETLRRYFLASLYAGRSGFALRDSMATSVTPAMADEQTAAALLISKALQENEELKGQYEHLDRLLTLIAGDSDDISPTELLEFAAGGGEDKATLTATRGRIVAAARTAGRFPRIVGGIVDRAKLEKGVSLGEATLSFRLLGQRFTPDSAAIQALVYDRVTDYQGKGSPFTLTTFAGHSVRGFPTVFDLMASLGSRTSRQILTSSEETHFNGYEKGLAEASRMMRRASHNPRSLSDMNLRLAYRLAVMPGGDALNSAIGAWIQNRYAMLLYAKQSYTAMSKAIRVEAALPKRSDAYVEPMQDLYGDMIENLYFLATVLETPALRERVGRFTTLLREVREIGYRQEEGEHTTKDIAFLNDIDSTMKETIGLQDRPLVVDIHTEPNSGMVVEEGIGFPRTVNRKALRGARFDCFEFKQPMDKRLTDDAWYDMLKAGNRPRSITDIITGL